MPYKSDNIRLSESQDRRRKLTEKTKEEIRELYAAGSFSLNQLARQYEVSKKTILLTVNPQSAERQKEYRKKNWRQWQRTGSDWAVIKREHRQYKRNLYLNGELGDE